MSRWMTALLIVLVVVVSTALIWFSPSIAGQ